jgi:hypothetical protein
MFISPRAAHRARPHRWFYNATQPGHPRAASPPPQILSSLTTPARFMPYIKPQAYVALFFVAIAWVRSVCSRCR